MGCKGVELYRVSQGRSSFRNVSNTLMKLRCSLKCGEFFE